MPTKRIIITNSIIGATLLVLGFFVFNLNLDQTYLSVTAPVYNGKRDSKQIALMFVVDDSTTAQNIPGIINALTNAKANATFFISGTTAINNLDVLQTISEKFELGNYGFTTTCLNSNDKNSITEEITVCHDLIKSLTNKTMNLLTPRDGLYNKNTLGIAANLGYRTVLPTARKVAIDWEQADSNLVWAYATCDTKAGDIIMLRPTSATMQCINQIITSFMERDLTVTSVGQLLVP